VRSGGAFFDQFIEDYFSECDEHLAAARRVLLALESASSEAVNAPPLDDLFRSLHTLKGLSGMVGDTCAERVAHALEDTLRLAERAGVGATSAPAFLDALFAGVDAIGRCVAAHRAGEPSPDVDAILGALAQRAADSMAGAAPRAPGESAAASGAERSGAVYHFEFLPSAALAARGVGVDAVRARLRALGTLLDAKPRVVPGGVAFDFWVAVPMGMQPDERWSDDGLRWIVADSGEAPRTLDGPQTTNDEPPRVDGTSLTAGGPSGTGGGTSASVVRVDLGRLDDVMRLVGDLVVSRARLDELVRQSSTVNPSALLDVLAETNAAMERQLRQLREGVMRIRLVQVGEMFERLRFAARDAIRESGKQVRLVLHGQSTEIDKVVVDRMLEPLLHLVRNAVSHGIERPGERTAGGKPAEGTLTLRATAAGDRIRIVVEDDGAGIDVDAVARRARARGLLANDSPLTSEHLLDVLCVPGFSTRDEADRTSGRGVGMDVVRSAVQALSG
jgi:two-component system, chemotaxis family, sensor kinase CheA